MTAPAQAPAPMETVPAGQCVTCRRWYPLSALAGGECLSCTCDDERDWKAREP